MYVCSSGVGRPDQHPNDNRSVKGVYGQSPNLLLESGQPAIDFTLYDYPGGNAWNLREELEAGGKPVVLIWGMFTCPAFQGMGDKPPIPPWDKCGYRDEYDMVSETDTARHGTVSCGALVLVLVMSVLLCV